MVLLAAAICSKDGKSLLSRQFVEMTRSRIEGLLAAFPKLTGAGKQHTFVETESVRYVYQPVEKLYVLLITTKASNILEDLETLRLFARVVPEYSKGVEEKDILKNAFEIIFAFDEVVALGYRENVNLSQVRSIIEMDSHEERVACAMRENQEREAIDIMKKKVREFQQQRRDAAKRGVKSGYTLSSAGNVGGYVSPSNEPQIEMIGNDSVKSILNSNSPKRQMTTSRGKALRLGHKGQNADSFVCQLTAEGESVVPASVTATATTPQSNLPEMPTDREDIHCRLEEKINVKARRDGILLNMELLGSLQVCIKNENFVHSRILINREEFQKHGIQPQTHPNIDKSEFQSGWIQSKPEKSYPLGQEVGVLRWIYQSQDIANIPLSINCWINEVGDSCEASIEYELLGMSDDLLTDVVISVPLPHRDCAPLVKNCDGNYDIDTRQTRFMWRIPLVDKDNKTGAVEFLTKGGSTEDFFPVKVSFGSVRSLLNIRVEKVRNPDGTSARYSSSYSLLTESYEIV